MARKGTKKGKSTKITFQIEIEASSDKIDVDFATDRDVYDQLNDEEKLRYNMLAREFLDSRFIHYISLMLQAEAIGGSLPSGEKH